MTRSPRAERRHQWLVARFKRNPRCQYCGNVTYWGRRTAMALESLHVTLDHADPLSMGGLDEPQNWRLCCYTCNQLKGMMSAKEYMEELARAGVLDNV